MKNLLFFSYFFPLLFPVAKMMMQIHYLLKDKLNYLPERKTKVNHGSSNP